MKLLRIALAPVVFVLAVLFSIVGALSIIGSLFWFLAIYLLCLQLVQVTIGKMGVLLDRIPTKDEIADSAIAASMPLWGPFFITAYWVTGGKSPNTTNDRPSDEQPNTADEPRRSAASDSI
jgi:hypothetical protein